MSTKQRYEVLNGLNYPNKDGEDVRTEAGSIVDDIPDTSTKWLLRDGLIEKTDKPLKKARA